MLKGSCSCFFSSSSASESVQDPSDILSMSDGVSIADEWVCDDSSSTEGTLSSTLDSESSSSTQLSSSQLLLSFDIEAEKDTSTPLIEFLEGEPAPPAKAATAAA